MLKTTKALMGITLLAVAAVAGTVALLFAISRNHGGNMDIGNIIFIILMPVVLIILVVTLDRICKPSKAPFNKENSEYANAVIYKFISGKYPPYILYYNYTVDGKKYKGWGKWYPFKDTLSLGDTIRIMYSKREPYKSITKRDFESK